MGNSSTINTEELTMKQGDSIMGSDIFWHDLINLGNSLQILAPQNSDSFFSLGWTNTKPVTDRIKVYPMAIYNMHLFCITAAPRKRLAANILVPCEYWANKTSRNTAGLLESEAAWVCLKIGELQNQCSIIYLKAWVTFRHFPSFTSKLESLSIIFQLNFWPF